LKRRESSHPDEVSAVVVDFGSHTTRAGYAGEDGPRVIAPSFYGYKEVEAGASGTNGTSNGGRSAANGDDDPMDGDKKEDFNNVGGGKKKTYYFGDDGVNVWREGMEVGNFMVDGMSEFDALMHPTCWVSGSDWLLTRFSS
jgi:actin-like protein 6A